MGMYRIKNIILGLGLGLVMASLININVQNKRITDDFIIKEAAKKGLLIIDPKDLINKSIDLENISDTREEESVKIVIEEKCGLHELTDVLFKSELIDDKQEFINYIKNFDKSIKCGSFSIKKGSTIDEIVNIITNQDE
ncbi:MAG: hypothetical protein M0P77_01265 [Firmicutes bacterium]|nr:hypothetical protein [Bacillota bacterium]